MSCVICIYNLKVPIFLISKILKEIILSGTSRSIDLLSFSHWSTIFSKMRLKLKQSINNIRIVFFFFVSILKKNLKKKNLLMCDRIKYDSVNLWTRGVMIFIYKGDQWLRRFSIQLPKILFTGSSIVEEKKCSIRLIWS